jgi:hypothetical protein
MQAVSGRSWQRLAKSAYDNSARFRRFIRNPASATPVAKTPANADYDDAARAAQ